MAPMRSFSATSVLIPSLVATWMPSLVATTAASALSVRSLISPDAEKDGSKVTPPSCDRRMVSAVTANTSCGLSGSQTMWVTQLSSKSPSGCCDQV
jgi:hypothetical protein